MNTISWSTPIRPRVSIVFLHALLVEQLLTPWLLLLANTKYFLFVSSGKLEDFKKLDTNNGSDGKLTFKVSPDFMYGQRDNTGRNRFLVYHQRDRTIFQVSWGPGSLDCGAG